MPASCRRAAPKLAPRSIDSISRRAAAQSHIGDICGADIERLCGTSHADAHLVECLQMTSPVAISPACNQAFTDTGWRTERAQQ